MPKIYAPTKEQVRRELEELRESEEFQFSEVALTSFEQLTDKAVLIRFPLTSFRKDMDSRYKIEAVWFPLSQMRELGGVFYFNNRMAGDKGLDV